MLPYTSTHDAAAVGKPLGIEVVFSEAVFGLTLADVESNGRVLSVEGQNRHYRIVVVPTQRILTVEVLTDGAHSIRGEGNEPLAGGPFTFDTLTNQIISNNNFRPRVLVASPIVYKVDAPGDLQPEVVQRHKVRFLFHGGVYPRGPQFINRLGQTRSQAGIAAEALFGFETISLVTQNNNFGLGYYLLAGYHYTPYETINNQRLVGSGPDIASSSGSYTAFPIEMGIGFHIGQLMTISTGFFTHYNGVYKHKGYFSPPPVDGSETVAVTCDSVNTNIDNGAIGGAINFTFRYRKMGFTLRYQRIQLNNVINPNTRFECGDADVQDHQYQTLNYFDNVGFFVTFNS